jgi:antitoxin component of MazEF toxin-antitoxin module
MVKVIEMKREKLSLNEWQLRKHWSIRRLAREAGISTETLLRLKKGGKVLPVTARKVVDALGITESDVLELDFEPTGDRNGNRNGYPNEITNIAVPNLDELLAGITPDNCHAPVDWGQPAGKELW